MTSTITRPTSTTHPHETTDHARNATRETGGDPDVLTSCITTEITDVELPDIDPIGIEPLDPLSKDCPEDLPCRVQDGELWFADNPPALEQAKAYCRECPALMACLAGALERREPWGVWGGEIFERGSIIARKRPRGRPRKADRTEVAA
jgi:WhiB family transcriptional regulator, redox-sensing transcriptional regulator